MASQKQLEANRLNASKSTGPRSLQGKARSSMNALKSGIDAESQIIRGEKVAALEALTADYYHRFHPTTPEQRMLVDTLVDAEWLLRRFRKVEAQLWEKEALSAYKPNEDVILAQAYWSGVDRFAHLQRRIDTAHKNYRTALQELERLQAEEVLEPELETSHATPRNESVKPRNGFVPASTPENPTVDLPSHPASLANPELVPRPHDQVPASRNTP
jgi:hypothetical protein